MGLGTISAIVALATTCVGLLTQWPPVAGYLASIANAGRQGRALGRIKGLIEVGDVVEIHSPDSGGGSANMGVWTVVDISPTRFLFEDKTRSFQLTPVEVEACRLVKLEKLDVHYRGWRE